MTVITAQVYQAVQQFASGGGSSYTDDSDSDNRLGQSVFGSPGVWARIHTIYYRYRMKWQVFYK